MEKEAAEKPDLKMNVLYDIACTLPKYLEVTVCFVQQKFNGIVTLTDPERVVASNLIPFGCQRTQHFKPLHVVKSSLNNYIKFYIKYTNI